MNTDSDKDGPKMQSLLKSHLCSSVDTTQLPFFEFVDLDYPKLRSERIKYLTAQNRLLQ